MGNNQTYKNRALKSLEGKWVEGIVASIILFLLSGGVSSVVTIPMGEYSGMGFQGFWALLCLPLGWGFTVFFLNLIRNQDISYERLFDGYKDFVRIFLAGFLVTFFEALGFLLLIVPGIILGLMWSQTAFILKDNKSLSASQAMAMSKEMMEGHKMELFKLWLSFLGWFILAVLTCGFGFLFLYPYFYSTLAHYYEDLKAERAIY